MPGDIVDARISQLAEAGAPVESIERHRAALMKEYGLDVSIPVQYGRWLGVYPQADGGFRGIVQGDFGDSLMRESSVIEDIAVRWPVTLELGLIALLVGLIVGLSIGIFSALRQDTWADYIARSIAIVLIAVPGFWVATMVIVFPSIWWGYMPPIRYVSFIEDPISNLRIVVIPAIVLGMTLSGMTMRMTRTMMLEVLRQDYIRTAFTKGLRERVVVFARPEERANGSYPDTSIFGGAVIIEQYFLPWDFSVPPAGLPS